MTKIGDHIILKYNVLIRPNKQARCLYHAFSYVTYKENTVTGLVCKGEKWSTILKIKKKLNTRRYLCTVKRRWTNRQAICIETHISAEGGRAYLLGSVLHQVFSNSFPLISLTLLFHSGLFSLSRVLWPAWGSDQQHLYSSRLLMQNCLSFY